MIFSNSRRLQRIAEILKVQWVTDRVIGLFFGKGIRKRMLRAFARTEMLLLWTDPEYILTDIEQEGAATLRVSNTLNKKVRV
jgi:hypothetical protein